MKLMDLFEDINEAKEYSRQCKSTSTKVDIVSHAFIVKTCFQAPPRGGHVE
ncbi:hypothetical protein RO3G_17320 [Rhizopus delemar RA 99-880]|uniref:Uncharacterized protein n=1 Tax=Rhizopus delemar (strain RA 99-880 / ATCC MYA-4621 / FGSC 9543 / NRRL 43880) TaxID=246409 RepID=I1CVX9_RHIO9|nr:hypothetical protein RO3G_17320 [Rhizopus delemar RA 99-880]|eukprot:EIE92609.1 hypothetical protein RO3G_17320 [Rhizopus delemar RA 99-880]